MNEPIQIYRAMTTLLRADGPLGTRARGWLAELARQLELDEGAAAEVTAAVEEEVRAAVAEGAPPPVDLEGLAPEEIARLEVGEGMSGVAFAPGGDRVAASGLDGRIHVFGVASGERLGLLDGHEGDANGLAFAGAGLLVSVGDDGDVRAWDVDEGGTRWIAKVHRAEAMCVATAPDGRHIASGGMDRRVAIVSAEDGAVQRQLETRDRVRAVAWSADGKLLAGGTFEGIHLWDAEAGAERPWIDTADREVLALAFSPEGLLAAGDDRGAIALLDPGTRQVRRTLMGHAGEVHSVAFASAGRLLVSGGEDDTLRLWDVEEGRELACLAGETGLVTGVAASPSEAVVACVGDGGDGLHGGREAIVLLRLA